MKLLPLLMLLHGCTLSTWADKPLGIYPISAAELNGPPVNLFGVKVKLPLTKGEP